MVFVAYHFSFVEKNLDMEFKTIFDLFFEIFFLTAFKGLFMLFSIFKFFTMVYIYMFFQCNNSIKCVIYDEFLFCLSFWI
jgi:hypothetical protein